MVVYTLRNKRESHLRKSYYMDYNLDHANQFSIIFVYMCPCVHRYYRNVYIMEIYIYILPTYTVED